jgi:hypothetical protein
MFKPTIIATAMIVLAGSSIVLAQQNSGAGNTSPDLRGQRGEYRYRPSTADMAAFTDASIAALRAGLELTPDQAKNWPAFEQALRDAAQLLLQAREARQQEEQTPELGQAPANPFPRLGQRADNLAKVSAALKRIADAGTPLYQSLTDDQKQRFMILVRKLRRHWIRIAVGRMGNRMTGHGMMGGNSNRDLER